MKTLQIDALVSEGILLDAKIRQLTQHLNGIKKLLVEEAATEANQPLHKTTEGGGTTVEFTDDYGNSADVMFPGPSLKEQIDGESKEGAKTLKMIGAYRDDLFTPVLGYKPVENFRERVRELFAAPVAVRIIDRVEKASDPRVRFKHKPSIEVAA